MTQSLLVCIRGSNPDVRYRETTKDHSTARAINTFLLGLVGLFGTRDKKVSEIEIEYVANPQIVSQLTVQKTESESKSTPSETASEALTMSSKLPENTQNKLLIVVRQRTGEDLVAQLEKLTGLKPAVLQPSRS